MLRPTSIALALVFAFAACGSPSEESNPDGTTHSDGGSSNTDGGSSHTDGGSEGELVRTATITLGDKSWTVAPEVRRGFIRSPAGINLTAQADKTNRSVTLTCAPGATPDQGGRRLSIVSGGQANSTGSATCEGGGLFDARFAVIRAARTACEGKSTCTVNLYDAFHEELWGCGSHSPDSISFDYSCVAQNSFAPAMVFEYESDDVYVGFSSLDGLGTASCSERALNLSVEPAGYTLGDTCSLELTTRTGSDAAGTLTVNLLDADGATVPLTVTFTHERNVYRPSVIVSTATSYCSTSTVTHTTTGSGDDEKNTLTAGPFACQNAGGNYDDPTTYEIEIKKPTKPREGFDCSGRVEVRTGGKSTVASDKGGSCTGAAMDEEPWALRAWLAYVNACDATDCLDVGTLFINYGFAPAAAP